MRMQLRSILLTFGTALLFGALCIESSPAQPTWRVNVDSSGQESNESPGIGLGIAAISGDGRFVAFASEASDLVSGDTNGVSDVFVHDLVTGETTRVSVSSTGTQGNGASRYPSISSDGRFVAFSSQARNLVPGDANLVEDVFVHDRLLGTTSRVNLTSEGEQAIGEDSEGPSISADGRYVVFWSAAANLVPNDENGIFDVFVRDRAAGRTVRVNVSSNGQEASSFSFSGAQAISADGRYVVFGSHASNLVPGDTNGEPDVFVHDRVTAQTTRVNVDSFGAQSEAGSFSSAISADGRYVAFHSSADDLVAGDTNGRDDVFVHDRQTGITSRVSVASSGAQGNGDSSRPSISADGRFISFYTLADDLVPNDTNAARDVLVRDRVLGITSRVSLDSAGEAPTSGDSFAEALSADGRFVVFTSDSTELVPDDTNDQKDLFVRDRVELSLHGRPDFGVRVSFGITNAFGEAWNGAQVLLSTTGTQPGFPLPGDGRTLYLVPDAVTAVGLLLAPALQGVILPDGTARTPELPFPDLPIGMTIHAAAVTIQGMQIVSLTSPISFVTE